MKKCKKYKENIFCARRGVEWWPAKLADLGLPEPAGRAFGGVRSMGTRLKI